MIWLGVLPANGPDGLSAKMLREAAPIVAPSLCRLINLSLRKLIFPSEWKKSNVTPIYKSGNATDCNNYRPISLISCAGQSWRG